MDVEALRRDFPTLKDLSEEEIETWILSNFSYVTETQLTLRGTVITPFEADRQTWRYVYHPNGYVRAAVAPFVRPGSSSDSLGLVDLKGIGYSPAGMQRISDFFGPIEKLKAPSSLTQEDLEAVGKIKQAAQEQLLAAEEELESLDEDSRYRNHFKHDISLQEQTVAICENLERLYNRALAGKEVTHTEIQEFIELLGKRDYLNGAAPLARLLKEVVIQKTAQRLMDEHAAKHGSRFQTVDHYFLIELPFKCQSPGGEGVAGIVGRQAHWRFNNVTEIDFPEDLPIQDTIGREQASVSGSLIDFENVAIDDPRVSAIMGHSSLQIDRMVRAAVRQNRFLRRRHIVRMIDSIVSRIPPAVRPSSNDSPSDDPLTASQILRQVKEKVGTITRDHPLVEKIIGLGNRDQEGTLLAIMALLAYEAPGVWETILRRLEQKEDYQDANWVAYETSFGLLHSRPKVYADLLKRSSLERQERAQSDRYTEAPIWLLTHLALLHGYELVRRELYRLQLSFPEFWMDSAFHLLFMVMMVEQHTEDPTDTPQRMMRLEMERSETIPNEIWPTFDHASQVFLGKSFEEPAAISPAPIWYPRSSVPLSSFWRRLQDRCERALVRKKRLPN